MNNEPNTDLPHRKFRFIEALDAGELKRSRRDFALIADWLELAEQLSPKTPKAMLEGDYVARIGDGAFFKELSFKSAHEAVELPLEPWSRACGRRWARIVGDEFVISDGQRLPLSTIRFEPTEDFT